MGNGNSRRSDQPPSRRSELEESSLATIANSSKTREKKSQGTKKSEEPLFLLPYPYFHLDSKKPETPNEKVVQTILERYANHDESMVMDFFHFGARIEFPGGMTVDVPGLHDMFMQMKICFSDFHFESKLIGETSPGIVKAEVAPCGTHDGQAFTTRSFPKPLTPMGARVKNDPEYFTCEFQGARIMKASFLAVSDETKLHGPDGFYHQIQRHNKMKKRVRKQAKKQTSPEE